MITSPIVTESELNTLNLVVPGHFKMRREGRRIFLEFYSPQEMGRGTLLFDYQICPASKQDFSGTLLAVVVEDLAATVANLHHELKDSIDVHPTERVLRIINGASQSVTRRKLPKREFQILTNEIYTMEEEKWFG